MAIGPISLAPAGRRRRVIGRTYGFGSPGFGLSGIVTPGTSTYPSDDGSFTIVRGSGEHWGNGLIGGQYIIAGTGGTYYDLSDNNTGGLLDPASAPKYKIGGELQRFLDSTYTSPEYYQYLRDQRAQQEQANPKLKEFDDALRRWAAEQPGIPVDPVFGFPTASIEQGPDYVAAAYADFTGNPIKQAPPPPQGPAMYLVAGILFGDDGTVYDQSTHQPTGQKLTPDQVTALKTTGQLPSSSTPAPSQPQPAVPGSPGYATPAPSAPPNATPVPPSSSAPFPSSSAPDLVPGPSSDTGGTPPAVRFAFANDNAMPATRSPTGAALDTTAAAPSTGVGIKLIFVAAGVGILLWAARRKRKR